MLIVRTETEADRRARRHRWKDWRAGSTALALSLIAVPSLAQVPATLNGAPIQVTPYAQEPGVPAMTIPTGTPTQTSPSTTGTGTGTSGTSAGGASGSDALNTLLSQSWGSTAVSEAEALGLNPSALAATCVMESGCQNVSGSGAQGAFQMFPAAYQEGLQTALAANPSLASQIVQGSAGMNDPATEAIAASGYLMQAVSTLQSAGISNPTVLDARSYYEFGPNYGTQVAQAQGSAVLSNILPQSFLSQNGISQTETVAQWQAGVSSKIGNAAAQQVLS
jgi:hypothetical protein